MIQPWEPGTNYNHGDVVEYQGHDYKLIQPHSSQSDWTPPVTPALWGRLSVNDHGDHHEPQDHQQPHPQQQQHIDQHPPAYGQPQGGYDQPSSDEKPHVSHEETKKHWYDLDDERKKQLQIGGGLAAGAALLAGGYFAFKEHEKSEEEKKAHTWALQNWVNEAKARTEQFYRNGPTGPATWILNKGKTIPQGAIEVGKEHSWTLYICRAYFDGGIQVGKASDAFKEGAVIGYKHEEIHVGTYEILIGDMRGLRWVPASGRLNVSALGYRPVEGGRENDGTPLYIAKAKHKDAVHPGKASAKLDGAYVPYDGKEKNIKEYEVLCYNNQT